MPTPPILRVLSLQSDVVAGHVGHAAARLALQSLGIEILALPTVLYSNHPSHGGFRGRVTPAEELTSLLTGLDERGFLDGIAAVQSGYLGAPDQAEIVRDAVLRVKRRSPDAPYLLDPVFGDEGGAYARPGVAEAMARLLLPLSDIVTPNRFELSSLTSRKVDDAASAVSAARSLGRKLVLATSVPCGDEIGTAAVTFGKAWLVATKRVAAPPAGTGDLLAALFLGRRLRGESIERALAASVGSVDHMIEAAGLDDLKEMPLVAERAALASPPRIPATQTFP